VFGLEGDIDWTNIRGSFTNLACPAGCETRNSYFGTVRGRIGYAGWGNLLPYVTGGLAFGDIQANRAGFAGANDGHAGWTIGGGVEFAFAGPWTAKVEYHYADLGSIGCSAASCGTASNANFRTSILRGGVNYRF
jgi:outer membrane immunogenic protein